jgi:tRNA (guanine-N7-)-methyltransferase
MPEAPARRSYAHAPRLPEAESYDLRELFSAVTTPELELELGCARGGFLLERLAQQSGAQQRGGCLVGFEIQLKAATQASQKIIERGYGERCRVFAGDVRVILPKLVTGSVQRVFMHFPDPWWKKRHVKRRLASLDMVREIERILTENGEFFVQTDVAQLAAAFADAVSLTQLVPMRGEPLIAENPYLARSPREKQATSDGLPIHRLWYRKPSP